MPDVGAPLSALLSLVAARPACREVHLMADGSTQKRTGPSIARGSSKSDYQTPKILLDAVQRRFGRLSFDLAANASNAVTACWYGPGHKTAEYRDSLACDWASLTGNLWVNPPFDPMAPWLKKACGVRDRAGLTLVLGPAAVGAEWYAEHVEGKAYVIALRPRVVFVGMKHGFPRDLAIFAYGFGLSGFDSWRWRP